MRLKEVQVDRVVGPTHHFGGLGLGNLASQTHRGQISNPAAAALQSLEKMKTVVESGAIQLIVPPHPQPNLRFLRSLGFSGADSQVLEECFAQSPDLFSAAMSCSAMWTANAATASAGVDNRRDQVSLTVANLASSIHRSLEPAHSLNDLRRCFPFALVAPALPGGSAMRDEGAANHMRLGSSENRPGVHVFVYGDGPTMPSRFWPRQSQLACLSVARSQKLIPENTFYLQQHPEAIDAGAFHNDVVAASHHDRLLYHEKSFQDADEALGKIQYRFRALYKKSLRTVQVGQSDLPLEEAVQTYLFNSQLLDGTKQGDPPIMLCPVQVRENPKANHLVQSWCDDGTIQSVHFVDLGQSMSGGGGPACLRLRVPLTEDQIERIPARCLYSEELACELRSVILDCYPKELSLQDLTNHETVLQLAAATERVRALL